jgi:dihydroorotase/N-acyl-D-amino-acid deacylase
VTHHKVIGKANWGKATDTLRLIDEARARGVDATLDQYPYTASSTSIQAALMPAYALEGGRDAVMKRLQTAGVRTEIKKETARLLAEERGGGDPQNVQLARCDWDHALDGKRLGDVTKGRGLAPTIDNAAETVLWIVDNGGCQGIFHAINEDDLQRILRHPATMIGSDGEIPIFGQASPHPRSYGTFVRVLGRYVRELKTITLEDAVHKMSAFPAQRIGLADRGVLREGLRADIAVFDPATVADRATFEQPHQYAVGVTQVIVNGQLAFEEGKMTSARPGRVLYGPAYRGTRSPQ